MATAARSPLLLPAAIQHLVQVLRFLEADQLAAGTQQGSEQLRLQLDIQQLKGMIQHRLWQHALRLTYGAEVGSKLGEHHIEVGMSLAQVIASYGLPDAGASGWHPTEPGTGWLRYGSPTAGSYFRVHAGRVTDAQLGNGAQPKGLFSLDLGD